MWVWGVDGWMDATWVLVLAARLHPVSTRDDDSDRPNNTQIKKSSCQRLVWVPFDREHEGIDDGASL